MLNVNLLSSKTPYNPTRCFFSIKLVYLQKSQILYVVDINSKKTANWKKGHFSPKQKPNQLQNVIV